MQQNIFIADLIVCSTCFGHHYAHHQELESIIQVVAAYRIWCLVFKLSVWCGAEGCVSGLRAVALHLLHLVVILFPHRKQYIIAIFYANVQYAFVKFNFPSCYWYLYCTFLKFYYFCYVHELHCLMKIYIHFSTSFESVISLIMAEEGPK